MDSKTEILTLDETKKPWLRYWGGEVEDYYLILIGKYNVYSDIVWDIYEKHGTDKLKIPKDILRQAEEGQRMADRYSELLARFREEHPHLREWWHELVGDGQTGVC